MNPASIPVLAPQVASTSAATPSSAAVAGPSAPYVPPGTPPLQDADGDVDMLDAPNTATGDNVELELNKPIYGPRDPTVKITAERVDVPEDAVMEEPAKLLLVVKNLDLKGKGKGKETEQPSAPKENGSDSDSDSDEDGEGDDGQAPGGARATGASNKKKKKSNKSNKKKKGKGRK